jgi:hypothetical protein
MNYAPVIKSAKPKQRFPIGKHMAVLLSDIEQAGAVQYRYIMAVFDGDTHNPCFFVASEVNSMAKTLGGGSHFLGLFDGDGHANCGTSDDWGDEAKFTAEALRIIRAKFGVQK